MTVAFRRGACPALSAPLQTGDGLLVRLALTGEALTPAQLIALCATAARHGNGMVEITARGNFQIRGLTPSSAVLLADEIAAQNLNLRDGIPVETGPLAGLDPDELADTRQLADAIRKAADATDLSARLSPKVSVVIDGGGRFDMADISADIRLTAARHENAIRWQIAIGGDAKTATPLGVMDTIADAKAATLSILERIAAHGHTARARDVVGAEALPSPLRGGSIREAKRGGGVRFASSNTPTPTHSAPTLPARGRVKSALLPLTDNRFAISAALPFGSIHADELAVFVNTATLGADEIRFAPGRRLILLCASETAANEIRAAASDAGLIVDADDPRAHIFACPGCPACASGNIPARDIATVVANEWATLLGGALDLHISGCAKGCAHPAPSAITLIGNGSRAALVIDGSAKSETAASVPTAGLKPALARLADAIQTDEHDTPRLAAAFAGD